MKLTILGKYGAFPGAAGGTSSYLIESNGTNIVLDFGSAALGRLLSIIKPENVNAIALSHLHYDHISDIFPLCYYLQANNITMDLYLPFTDCLQFELIKAQKCFNLFNTSGCCSFNVKNLELHFNKQIHSLESNSVIVKSGNKKIFYSGDTVLNDNLMHLAAGCDLLLLDCGKQDGTVASHMSLSEVEQIADRLKINVIATHINPQINYSKFNSPYVSIAQEMKIYTI